MKNYVNICYVAKGGMVIRGCRTLEKNINYIQELVDYYKFRGYHVIILCDNLKGILL